MSEALQLTIYGKVPSKSSSRIIVKNRRTGMPMVISSAMTRQYEKDFEKQVLGHQKGKFTDDDRLRINLFWFTDSYRQDVDAPAKAIFDNLQKCGVIVNDNRIDEYQIARFIDKDNPRVMIQILKLEKANG